MAVFALGFNFRSVDVIFINLVVVPCLPGIERGHVRLLRSGDCGTEEVFFDIYQEWCVSVNSSLP